MNEISVLAKNMNYFVDNIENNVNIAVQRHEPEILDLIREQIKDRQVTGSDVPILPEYAPQSPKRLKKGLTSPDLYDTGEFQKQLKLYPSYPSYGARSFSRSYAPVMDKYNKKGDLLKVAPSNQDKAKEITTNELTSMFKQKTGL